MDITFTGDEWYDHHRRKVVWFTALVDGKPIECGISIEALIEHFGAYQDDPLPAFRSNRQRIDAIAEALIRQQRFENDDRIVIRSADL